MSNPVEETPKVAETSKTSEPAKGPNPEYVSKAEYDALLKRLDGQSGVIARLEKSFEKKTEPVQEKPEIVERVKAVEERQKKLDEREKRQRDREAKLAVRTALANGGVEDSLVPDVVELFTMRNADKIKVDDDMNVYVEDSGKKCGLEEYVQAYLNEDGQKWLPAKRNPKSDGLNPGSVIKSGARKVSRADLMSGKVQTKDLIEGKVVLVD